MKKYLVVALALLTIGTVQSADGEKVSVRERTMALNAAAAATQALPTGFSPRPNRSDRPLSAGRNVAETTMVLSQVAATGNTPPASHQNHDVFRGYLRPGQVTGQLPQSEQIRRAGDKLRAMRDDAAQVDSDNAYYHLVHATAPRVNETVVQPAGGDAPAIVLATLEEGDVTGDGQ